MAAKRRLPGIAILVVALTSPAAVALVDGEPAPAFSLPALDAPAERVSLAGQRGKVLYIDFWSAWCAPCREAMPALAALREKYAGARFEVVGINVDPAPDAARRLLRRLRISYPTVSDAGARTAKAYGVKALPAAVIVDADGVVRHVAREPSAKDMTAIEAQLAALIEAGLQDAPSGAALPDAELEASVEAVGVKP